MGAGWSSASVCAALLCSRLWHVDSTHVCWAHGELAPFFGSAAQLTNCCGNTRNARLAQSAERKALNLVVVGSSSTVGVFSVDWWSRAVMSVITYYYFSEQKVILEKHKPA